MVELERAEALRPAEEGARLVALRQLDEVRAALARAGDPGDEEAVHDVRVALRRLRSSLGAYRPLLDEEAARRGLERAGKLAGQMGDARDAEVRIAWLERALKGAKPSARKALDELAKELRARLALGRARAVEGLGDRFEALEAELRASLLTYPAQVAPARPTAAPSFALAVHDALRDAAEELERALEAVTGPGDVRAEHEARIDAKRVRYVLEPVRTLLEGCAPVLAELRRLQDLLGDRHDRAELCDVLRGALERAALATAQGLAETVRARDERGARRLRVRPVEKALLELLARARDESDALWSELASQWLFGKSAPFFARVRELGTELRRLGAPNQEIERKYLLRGLPARVADAEALELEQGYLPGPARERLRRAVGPRGTRLTRTVKVGSGLVRAEYEEEVAPSVFERLWPETAGARVRKRRYHVLDGELVWEVDEFLDRELWLAEIELPSADTEVAIPDWLEPYLEREVTGEPGFANLALAR